MKRIVDFKSSNGVYYINLENVPGSTIFTEPDGGVTISEGPSIKMGTHIKGEDVECLGVVPVNGIQRVLLHYNKEGEPLTHVLGEIEEESLDAAKDWINKTAQIYKPPDSTNKKGLHAAS